MYQTNASLILNWKIGTTDVTDYTDFMREANCLLIHFLRESKILLFRNLLIRYIHYIRRYND